jgi:hypothetical protein
LHVANAVAYSSIDSFSLNPFEKVKDMYISVLSPIQHVCLVSVHSIHFQLKSHT